MSAADVSTAKLYFYVRSYFAIVITTPLAFFLLYRARDGPSEDECWLDFKLICFEVSASFLEINNINNDKVQWNHLKPYPHK